MFGQYSVTNTQKTANLDILKNNNKSPASDTKPLFPPPSAPAGRLFYSANDLAQNTSSLPTKTVTTTLETSPSLPSTTIATATNVAPSVLIPSEGKITKGSLDNALPIFFAGAQQHTQKQQQQQQQSSDQGQETLTEAADLTTQPVDEPSVVSSNPDVNSKDDTMESTTNSLDKADDEIRTIKIFGFPPNMADTLRQHFEKYGRVESSQHSPGNWLSIMYALPTSATTAVLKSNRMVIADSFMIGVTLATQNLKPIPSKSVLKPSSDHKQQHHQHQDHAYKSVLPVSDAIFADRSTKKKSTAGTGQAGISVVGGSTVTTSNRTTIPETTGWVGFFRDILFG